MTDSTPPGEDPVEIDDPFDIPAEVDEAWEEDDTTEGEAPSG
jgi:hypothetical protein